MKRKIIAIALFSLLFSVFADTLSDIGNQFLEEAQNTKNLIAELRKNLEKEQYNNQLIQSQLEFLQEQTQILSDSIDKTYIELAETKDELTIKTVKINNLRKVLIICICIFVIMIIIKILIMLLKSRLGITLPYWLNCLL